jgi:hypothetical protein
MAEIVTPFLTEGNAFHKYERKIDTLALTRPIVLL